MPRSQFNQSNLTALTKSSNLLSGDINEFVKTRSMVTVYAVSSASGIRMSLLADSDVAVDDKEIVGIGTSLLVPDHIIDSFAVGPGTRLALTLRETANVSTTDILVAIDVQPF